MASGLPVAVSDRCGCAEVLIDDGVTGLLFDPFDVTAMTRTLERLTDTTLAATLATGSRVRIAAWGPERFGSGMADAARAAVARPARPKLLDRAVLELVSRRG